MQQSIVVRPKGAGKSRQRAGVKVGRWGVVNYYFGGQRAKDPEKVLQALTLQRTGRKV